MKHTHLATNFLPALLFAITGSSLVHAADRIQVDWTQVCRAAAGNQLAITTTNGDTVDGYCIAVNVNEVSINTDHGIVKVARTAFSRIQMHRPHKGHQLRALGNMMRKSLAKESDWLLSPHAPAGLVSIPPTIAWGAVAVPFCLLGDLKDKLSGVREIQVN